MRDGFHEGSQRTRCSFWSSRRGLAELRRLCGRSCTGRGLTLTARDGTDADMFGVGQQLERHHDTPGRCEQQLG